MFWFNLSVYLLVKKLNNLKAKSASCSILISINQSIRCLFPPIWAQLIKMWGFHPQYTTSLSFQPHFTHLVLEAIDLHQLKKGDKNLGQWTSTSIIDTPLSIWSPPDSIAVCLTSFSSGSIHTASLVWRKTWPTTAILWVNFTWLALWIQSCMVLCIHMYQRKIMHICI